MSFLNPTQFIGSEISLITFAGGRYEGVLFNINPQESTVTLTSVRSFGTEGRNPEGEIPSSDKIYDFIVFKGKDIKDLSVSEPSAPEDPAILAISSGLSMQHKNNSQRLKGVKSFGLPENQVIGNNGVNRDYRNVSRMIGGINQSYDYNPHEDEDHTLFPIRNRSRPSYPKWNFNNTKDDFKLDNKKYPFTNYANSNRYGNQKRGGYGNNYAGYRGRGSYSGNRRIIGELSAHPNETLKSKVEKAFDFDLSNSKFEKSMIENENQFQQDGNDNSKSKLSKVSQSNNDSPNPVVSYDKNTSFFDSISCEASNRLAGNENRIDRNKQRQLDYETFGHSVAQLMKRNNRRYKRGSLNPQDTFSVRSNRGNYHNSPNVPVRGNCGYNADFVQNSYQNNIRF